MKLLLAFVFVCQAALLSGQDLTGTWEYEWQSNDNKYEYKLHLKKTTGNYYLGTSELRRKMQVTRGSYLSLGRALEKRPKTTRRVLAHLTGDTCLIVEFAPIETDETSGFNPYSFQAVYLPEGKKPHLQRVLRVYGDPQYNFERKDDDFPDEYNKYVTNDELFLVETPVFNSVRKDGKLRFNDQGVISLSLQHNLGFDNRVKVSFALVSAENILLPDQANGWSAVSSSPTKALAGYIKTGFTVPTDSAHFTLTGAVEGIPVFTRRFAIATEPFFKTTTTLVSANSQNRLKAVAGHFGFGDATYKSVEATLDPLVQAGDKLAAMWQAVFEYLGYGGYTANEAAAAHKAAVLFPFVQEQARNGDAESLYLLFYACEMGAGGADAKKTSRLFLEKAAGAGYAPAIHDLAIADYQRRNYASAMSGLVKAYDAGMRRGASAIGHLYEKGYGVSKNVGKATEWYAKGIAYNDPEALMKMAFLLSSGEEAEPNVAQAVAYATRAAGGRSTAAMLYLGNLTLNGRQGIVQDVPQAIKWFRQAAELGDQKGMEALAFLYISDALNNFPKDEKSSYFWARKAAEAGSPNAMGLLARIYDEGSITAKSVIKSRFWYNQAVLNGYGKRDRPSAANDFLNFLKHADFSPTYYVYQDSWGSERVVSSGPDLIGGVVTGLLGSYLESRLKQQRIINGLELVYEKEGRKIYGGTITSAFLSELEVKKGDTLSIASFGTVKLGWMLTGGPDGVGGYQQYSHISNLPHGSVILGIGNDWAYIGAARQYVAPADGKLGIAINDADYSNNQGYFDIVIEQRLPRGF